MEVWGGAELTNDIREIKKDPPHTGSGVGCIQVVFEKSSEVAHRDQPPCMQGRRPMGKKIRRKESMGLGRGKYDLEKQE